jgi:hypothetical protein
VGVANPLAEYEVVFAELLTIVVRKGSLPACIEANAHETFLQLSVDDWAGSHARDSGDLHVIAMLATRISTHVEPFGRRLVVITMPILI